MFLEIFLVSVVIVTGWLGLQLLRRGGPPRRAYAYMLLANGLVALVAIGGGRSEPGESADVARMLGAIAVGAFLSLVFVPPILRDLARRAISADRIRLAVRLLDLRELLQPGMGARQEREFLVTDSDVRAGRVDQALEALRARRGATDNPMLRRAIDERIVFTLLFARRWRAALDHFERFLDGMPGPTSAPLLVEIVRAYGEEGDLTRAAELMDRLERSPVVQEPLLALLVARARMVFLAFTGRAAEVELLLAPANILGVMPPAARSYWIGVARYHGGDAAGARAALDEAVKAAGRDPRSRQIAVDLLAEIDKADRPPQPRLLTPEVIELADRLAVSARRPRANAPALAALPRLDGLALRDVPVTSGIIAANFAVALAVHYLIGSSEDPAALVRAGANLHSAVRAGEWWRLQASTLLHVGVLHLVINMYGLWVLGKLVEQFLGRVRYFAVYSLAGLGGALASVLSRGDGLSAGASGAVFGILGAAIAELALRRKEYPERWRKALLQNLLFLAVANLVIGGMYPAIDQAAHVGGLVVGLLATAVLAPRGRVGRGKLASVFAAGIAGLAVGATAWATFAVVTTTHADTLMNSLVRRPIDGGSMEIPGAWVSEGSSAYVDPTFAVGPTLQGGIHPHDETMADIEEAAARRLLARDGGDSKPRVIDAEVVEPWLQLPGWRIVEVRVVFDLPWGRRWYRHSAYMKRVSQGVSVLFELLIPEQGREDLAPLVTRMLSSVQSQE